MQLAWVNQSLPHLGEQLVLLTFCNCVMFFLAPYLGRLIVLSWHFILPFSFWFLIKQSGSWMYRSSHPDVFCKKGSRKIASEENCPPALILTLMLNQTLTLTGGNFPRGQFSGHRKKGVLRNYTKLTEKHLCQGLFFNYLKILLLKFGVFLWIFRNFQEHLFSKTRLGDCF